VSKTNQKLIDQVEELQELLIARATNGADQQQKARYSEIRKALVNEDRIKQLLPEWFVESRSLDETWSTFRQTGKWAERREMVWKGFRPLLAHLERDSEASSSQETPQITTYCDDCGRRTKHYQRVEYHTDSGGEVIDEHGFMPIVTPESSHFYAVVECLGCSRISFRESAMDYDWGDESELARYPKPKRRARPTWLEKLKDSTIRTVLLEVYTAFDHDLLSLCTMGSRAVLDLLIVDLVGDQGTFNQKLQKMVDEGHLSAKHRDVLVAALDVGHAASHRGYLPTPERVVEVLDILEHLLLGTYILPDSASNLRSSTPARARATHTT